jgi:hypothetical protein
MTDTARAFAEDGFELGLISQASGGGMSVEAASAAALARLQMGTKLKVTIVEDGSPARNSFRVEVRNLRGNVVGLEFL